MKSSTVKAQDLAIKEGETKGVHRVNIVCVSEASDRKYENEKLISVDVKKRVNHSYRKNSLQF